MHPMKKLTRLNNYKNSFAVSSGIQSLLYKAGSFSSLLAFILFLYCLLIFTIPAMAKETDALLPGDLTVLSLEELMEIEVTVTSVSKKSQKISEAPAAIFVISQEDIRRSGATSIPEILRMVPGLEVARIDANKWAISSRGFNGRFANKLLVLIDGRSAYTPLFSGVFWDMQDTVLDDIERIEIIRGPGANMWGANAVNGVINIITKNAASTQGNLLSVGTGGEERGFITLRHGGKLGEKTYYRGFFKFFDRDGGIDEQGSDSADSWSVYRAGFRVDSEATPKDMLTVQGDIFSGKSGVTFTSPTLTTPFSETIEDDTEISGGNVLARWTHAGPDNSEMALQVYFDRTEIKFDIISELRNTIDLDFQHRFSLGAFQEIVWGLGYRYTEDEIQNSFHLTIDPDDRNDNLYSAFIEDELRLYDERLIVTVGSKLEHNNYTGIEVQPSARALWQLNTDQSVWAAVSRAVRTPSRADDDIRINQQAMTGAPPVLISIFGDSDFESEDLLAYEVGYRVRPAEWLSLDIATFYNQYDNLRTLELGSPYIEATPAPVHIVLPATAANKMDGETYGIEIAADALALEWLHFQLAYTFLQMELNLESSSTDTTSRSAEGQSPHHQISLLTSMNIRRNVELDLWIKYVDELPSLDIDSYISLDTRLSWWPKNNMEISLVGQNLLDNHQLQYKPELIDILPTEVERSVYGKLTWQF